MISIGIIGTGIAGLQLGLLLQQRGIPTTIYADRTPEVARLKGNIGDQNYELPADLDLSQYRAVVIYCKRFSDIFSTAELLTSQN
jgi:2-polyprenyl-6-methoxyphenol hydroxylase-like FAD-dependent oxidoreductase